VRSSRMPGAHGLERPEEPGRRPGLRGSLPCGAEPAGHISRPRGPSAVVFPPAERGAAFRDPADPDYREPFTDHFRHAHLTAILIPFATAGGATARQASLKGGRWAQVDTRRSFATLPQLRVEAQ